MPMPAPHKASPPFRYMLSYEPPTLSPEEMEAVQAGKAEYEDTMGLYPDDDRGVVLDAETFEDAEVEAGRLWRDDPHDRAIGYLGLVPLRGLQRDVSRLSR